MTDDPRWEDLQWREDPGHLSTDDDFQGLIEADDEGQTRPTGPPCGLCT